MRQAFRSLKNKWTVTLISLMTAVCAFFLVIMIAEAAEYSVLITFENILDEKSAKAFSANLYAIITVMSYAAALFITVPITVGFKRVIFLAVKGKTPDIYDVFWCYSLRRLIRTVGLKFTVGLKIFLWSALFIVPAFLSQMLLGSFAAELVAVYVKFFLIGVGICVALAKLVSYSAADFNFFENEDMKTREIISKSVSLFGLRSGNFGTTALLYISLVPVLLTCVTVLPILKLFLLFSCPRFRKK